MNTMTMPGVAGSASGGRKIVLASASHCRKRLLDQLGIKFEVRGSEYQEDMQADNNPYELARFLALKKAEDVARHYNDAIIIAADTFIVDEGKGIGKPRDAAEAKAILRRFSGREHSVITGFAIIDTKSKAVVNDFSEAKVKFRELSDEEIDDYVATGEPLGMAGSYGLMDKAAVLIESISGDFYVIIGLPLNRIFLELKKMGVNLLKQ
jgi:septum formation protein